MMGESDVQERSPLRDLTQPAGRHGWPLAGSDDFWVEWQQSADREEDTPSTRESVDVQPARFGSAEVGLGQVRGDLA